jgi:hypothetical protein
MGEYYLFYDTFFFVFLSIAIPSHAIVVIWERENPPPGYGCKVSQLNLREGECPHLAVVVKLQDKNKASANSICLFLMQPIPWPCSYLEPDPRQSPALLLLVVLDSKGGTANMIWPVCEWMLYCNSNKFVCDIRFLARLLICVCWLVTPQEHRVQTRCGTLSVSVYGDEDKPALITYPDVALNCECLRYLKLSR